MTPRQPIFTQVMDFIPTHQFRKCVQRYQGNYKVRTFTCWDQFLSMAFAQFTYRESLRDIEMCLHSLQPKLYHAGFRGTMSRSTLADANEQRDWRIYADFASVFINQARKLYAQDDFDLNLEQTAYAFDSTTISLCLSLFPWAKFRRTKAAVKLHTQIDLRGNIPCFIHITDGKTSDTKALDELVLEPGAFYIMDRGYIDFDRLYRFVQETSFFLVQAKSNLSYTCRDSRPVDKSKGLRADQTIVFKSHKASRDYPDTLRRISYVDPDTSRRFVFLTNNQVLPALTITQLYRCRWKVELFFKWIKQHLRIKSFYGTSENAVKTQIWIAVSIYALIAILKKKLNLQQTLGEILQILSVTLFEKINITQLFSENPSYEKPPNLMGQTHNQLYFNTF